MRYPDSGGIMEDLLLITYCSPTLAGMKTGSLFRFRFSKTEERDESVRRLNRLLNPKGVSVCILLEGQAGSLIYVYRPRLLIRDLTAPEAADFLAENHYRAGSLTGILSQLSERLTADGGFPHEIGLFLGYPLEDVKGFIRNKGQNPLCCGIWKVYSDPEKAKQRFFRYEKCRQIYCRRFTEGFPLTRLTVAV